LGLPRQVLNTALKRACQSAKPLRAQRRSVTVAVVLISYALQGLVHLPPISAAADLR